MNYLKESSKGMNVVCQMKGKAKIKSQEKQKGYIQMNKL